MNRNRLGLYTLLLCGPIFGDCILVQVNEDDDEDDDDRAQQTCREAVDVVAAGPPSTPRARQT